jgi:CxxC motif-containing protein (DUF1111 family)
MIPGYVRALVMLASIVVAAALGIRSSQNSERSRAEAAPRCFAPFGEPLPGLDGETRVRFERGRQVAMHRFTPSTGLGPEYNATSCRGCHEKPVTGGGASRYRGVYVTSHSKKTFVVPMEHHFSSEGVAHGVGRSAMHTPPPFFGVGLLAEVPVKEIIARADPSDRDGDGVSGKVNFERGFIGRFGRKAQMASLQGFVRLALLDQMGVTTAPAAPPSYLAKVEGPMELGTVDGDKIADPEIAARDLDDLLAFVGLLAPPPPDPPTQVTRAGEKTFTRIGCATCHVPSLKGPRGPVPAYTDLLLHDMGPDLADGVTVGEANGNEFRTQPLWGLGAAGPFMHDGRADTVDAAIRQHAGEGEGAKGRYVASSEGEQKAVQAFLLSLGGSHTRHDGLLPEDAPVLATGAVGGPLMALGEDEARRFTHGREVFDHDFSKEEGLGPSFNGDACRSCHFDPVIGGSGPADVDVVRHGLLDARGEFALPRSGDSMAHRFGLAGPRPAVDERANLFERRQTPSIFGLGLVDAIPEEAIVGRADPDDRDGDGVRGVVSRVADGRVGRFGWKAQQASLSDFADDAFRNELGVVPPKAGAKGEIAQASFDDLVFFMSSLAPPAPRRTSEADAASFARFECQSCHTPEMRTHAGEPVRLFSDLLLHDVATKNEHFVVQGSARSFRTPLLWGIAQTAPYFHDGMSETLDAAVRRHDGEATKSREHYLAASDEERAGLLRFLQSL